MGDGNSKGTPGSRNYLCALHDSLKTNLSRIRVGIEMGNARGIFYFLQTHLDF